MQQPNHRKTTHSLTDADRQTQTMDEEQSIKLDHDHGDVDHKVCNNNDNDRQYDV